jgi:hypothetical protein
MLESSRKRMNPRYHRFLRADLPSCSFDANIAKHPSYQLALSKFMYQALHYFTHQRAKNTICFVDIVGIGKKLKEVGPRDNEILRWLAELSDYRELSLIFRTEVVERESE